MKHRQKSLSELERKSIEDFQNMLKHPVSLILDNIRSMQNVGSIFRSADCFGIFQIILLGITPKPPHREIHKTALGAEQAVSWHHADKIDDAIKLLPRDHVLVALEQTTHSQLLHQYKPKSIHHALVLGNEVKGVSPEVLEKVDLSLEIFQEGTKHSLNVSNSASVALYHLTQVYPLK